MPDVVALFMTTSIMPTPSFFALTPVAITRYGFNFKSWPLANHIRSITRSICSVRISCLKSSPDLKMTYTLPPLGSAFLNTSHNGTIFELIYLHFSTMSVVTSTFGFRGSCILPTALKKCSLSSRSRDAISPLQSALLFFSSLCSCTMRALTPSSLKTAKCCFFSSTKWEPHNDRYSSKMQAYRSQNWGEKAISAFKCQKKW
mmetsp:Transcript_6208/g.10291  ORF Transcript_6208/g.10291 Transcript_6208/m.10291 type:complete len:202 (-) Transcript_6208:1825-2430(-)